ncbi:hypothetical protein BpHYR1_049057 [Brachionus plicatilis]|uniref:RNA-directed DNA polymerase from mobile element jockey-like n=1 Tax=Brachionus plicatilis TaxID=10195 RepID=A0A3M7SEG6_BRAPC|nr:hypothetical protein BpHYR1_049057 [Brachionus plicatilis]
MTKLSVAVSFTYCNEQDCSFYNHAFKILIILKVTKDIQNIQKDIDSLVAWAKEWRMAFNYEKCKSMGNLLQVL